MRFIVTLLFCILSVSVSASELINSQDELLGSSSAPSKYYYSKMLNQNEDFSIKGNNRYGIFIAVNGASIDIYKNSGQNKTLIAGLTGIGQPQAYIIPADEKANITVSYSAGNAPAEIVVYAPYSELHFDSTGGGSAVGLSVFLKENNFSEDSCYRFKIRTLAENVENGFKKYFGQDRYSKSRYPLTLPAPTGQNPYFYNPSEAPVTFSKLGEDFGSSKVFIVGLNINSDYIYTGGELSYSIYNSNILCNTYGEVKSIANGESAFAVIVLSNQIALAGQPDNFNNSGGDNYSEEYCVYCLDLNGNAWNDNHYFGWAGHKLGVTSLALFGSEYENLIKTVWGKIYYYINYPPENYDGVLPFSPFNCAYFDNCFYPVGIIKCATFRYGQQNNAPNIDAGAYFQSPGSMDGKTDNNGTVSSSGGVLDYTYSFLPSKAYDQFEAGQDGAPEESL
jgi:hypothetical protein